MGWSDQDQGRALAWAIEQKGKCGTCGTSPWQWGDNGEHPTLEVDGTICFGCEQLERQVERDREGPPMHGRRYGMYPIGAADVIT